MNSEVLHRWLKTQHPLLAKSEEHRGRVARYLIQEVPAIIRNGAFNPNLDPASREGHLRVLKAAMQHAMEKEWETGTFTPMDHKTNEQPTIGPFKPAGKRYSNVDKRSRQ